ncbi:hypothetical protein TSAR_002783 [Trichomalopsis sarcophagae]|uniref:Geminin n=1 Tax=Trichomalopsis sarcophagae TaxID=543379 RepID=A0A232FJU2_9HYME|nr:hypothetical protein TSAR_002783 [Trichomalopsis sarcophagae]
MRPGGSTKVAAVQTTISEEKVRKSLHPLQPAATDKENLVGAGRQLRSTGTGKDAIKNEMSAKMVKGDVKKTVDKAVVAKTETSKKVSEKPKTETRKVQKEGKKDGRVFKDRGVQTEPAGKVKVSRDDLTSEAGPSENYWEVLAERRGVALHDALEENRILHEQLKVYKEMLDESRALVEVLQDMIGEDRNDINNSLDDSRL